MNSRQTNRLTNPDLTFNYKLKVISDLLVARLPDLLDSLHLDYTETYQNFAMCCPIHGGDTHGKCVINNEDSDHPGSWACWSRNCHGTFRGTIIGFVRGVLSHQRLGWSVGDTELYPWNDTISWLCAFLGLSWASLEVSPESLEKFERNSFTREFGKSKKSSEINLGVTRDKVRRSLIIPAQFYLEKGYTESLLDSYDIGLRNKPGADFNNRIVVPLYDSSGNYLVAATARSIFPECPRCSLHHDTSWQKCPEGPARHMYYAKWRHTVGFDKSHYLFNHWKNLGLTRQRRSVILCESIGDVLRLEDSGIKGSVALFGCDLLPGQQTLLDEAGVMTLIVLLNNDEAGLIAAEKLRNKYKRYYRIFFPNLLKEGKNDYGDLCKDEVTREVKPILAELMK